MTIAFVVICAIMILISYYISHNMINIVSIFTVPYMLFVPINNLLMVKRGFFRISNPVICMLSGCLACILIGYILVNSVLKVSTRHFMTSGQQVENMFSLYRIDGMLKYALLVEAVAFTKFIVTVATRGLSFVAAPEFEGYMLRGPVGHLMLTIYPIIPILFLYWLHNKERVIYLCATIGCLILLFLTFVKYHVIGMIVLIFLFVAIEDKKYLRKGVILVSAVAIVAFILNYLISFLLRGVFAKVTQEYYFNHLWTYMAGSLINDNEIFTSGIRVNTSIFYKLGTVIFALPNPFIGLFGGEPICPHIALSFMSLGKNGERGNVVDTFGYFYPSKGSIMDIAFYVLVLILIGICFTIIYNRAIRRTNHFRVSICIFMTFFMFFSFFGTFYIFLIPWEILVWSAVMLTIFDKRVKIRFGR